MTGAMISARDHLDELAVRARGEHQQVQEASANALALAGKAVMHAMNAGDALIGAKAEAATRGIAWKMVLEKCGIAPSTDRLYRQLSKCRPVIEAEIQRGGEFSLRAARRLISKPAGKKNKVGKETLEAHWNRASKDARTAFLDAIGVAGILESMSADFGRDLRSRVPTPKSKQTDGSKTKKRSTAKTTDSSGNTVSRSPRESRQSRSLILS